MEDAVCQVALLVVSLGGMGQQIARHIAPGTQLVLADFNPTNLDTLAAQMRAEGYELTPLVVDVSKHEAVAALAEKAEISGRSSILVHTAGINADQGSVNAILAVNLLGVALVAEEFEKVIAPGGVGLLIPAGLVTVGRSCLPPPKR